MVVLKVPGHEGGLAGTVLPNDTWITEAFDISGEMPYRRPRRSSKAVLLSSGFNLEVQGFKERPRHAATVHEDQVPCGLASKG